MSMGEDDCIRISGVVTGVSECGCLERPELVLDSTEGELEPPLAKSSFLSRANSLSPLSLDDWDGGRAEL